MGTEPRNHPHAGGWPVQPDAGLLEALVDRLSAPSAPVVQVLRGGSGSGKTTLIEEVAVRLQSRGFSVLATAGHALLRDVPLAAFAPLLAQLPHRPARVEDQVALLVARVLPGAARHVLLVDDAHHVDRVSVGVLEQLLDGGVRCLLATPPTPGLDPATQGRRSPVADLVTVWHGRGRLEQVQVPPLTEGEAARLVTSYTAGMVDRAACEVAVARAGGNPQFLRELARAAVDGELTPAPAVPTPLAGLIAHRWAGVDDDVLALAQTVALTGRWPLALCPSRAAVDQLLGSEVLQCRDKWLMATHPLVADVLSSSMAPGEQATRRREAARHLEAAAHADAEHRFMAIALRHRAGDSLPVTDLLWAGWHAHRAGDHQLAEHLADSALASPGGARAGRGEDDDRHDFDGLLLRATARSSMGHLDSAEQDFADIRTLAVTRAQRARHASAQGWHLAMRRHDHDGAIELGNQTLAEWAESGESDGAELATLRADVGQWQITQLMLDHDVAEARAAYGMAEVLTRVAVAAYGADLAGLRSALTEAEAMIGQAEPTGHGPELIALGRLFELVLDGHCETALSRTRARREQVTLPDQSAGTWAFMEALLAAHCGYPLVALGAGERAVALLSADDLTGTLGPATALQAALLAREGQQDAARRVAAGIAPDPRTDDKTAVFLAEALAWQRWHPPVAGAGEDVGQVLAPAVVAADRAGRRTYAILAAHLAVCLGAADAVRDHLRQLARVVPSPLVAAVLAHAEAAVAGDGSVLLEAAAGLEEVGLHAGAIDAAQQAARCARGPQRRAELSQAADLIARCHARGATQTVPSGRAGPIGLTGRELLVAHATVELGTSRAVAAELGVSVRTIDNQLRVIYRKFGIAGRDQLAAALRQAAGRQHT